MSPRWTALALVALAAAGLPGDAGARAASPSRVLVTATEFRLSLSRTSVAPGASLVQLSNRGQDAHDLVARRLDRRGREAGPRVVLPAVPSLATGTLRLTLRQGHYVLFCSLPGHRARGMRARLRVAR